MKDFILKRIIIIFIIVTFLLSCQKKNESKIISEIRMGIIPTEDVVDQLENHKPLTNFLSKELGIPVSVKVTMDYSSLIEAMRYKHIEIGYLGPFSYIIAHKIANAIPLVTGIRKDTNKTTYTSIIVAGTDKGINSVEDLKGKTFAFLDPASTSGYLVPMVYFNSIGLKPEKDFKSVIFAGSHEAVELAVFYGKVDAGADNRPTYERMLKNGIINAHTSQIIWESDPIPGSPICMRGDLPAELIRRVQDILVKIPPGVISFEGEMIGYTKAEDRDYDIIRSIAKVVDLDYSKF